jgi:hypothetical protein
VTTSSPKSSPYNFPVDRCDVFDKAQLKDFRKKRAEWVDLLEKDHLHSVGRQLSSLVWQDAVFRLINEARRLQDPLTPTSSMASIIVEALGEGYVTGLVLGVSRLTDPKEKSAKRNVVSLRRVFEDIREHSDLMTREIFVCYDGCVYDPHKIPPPSSSGPTPAGPVGFAVGGPRDFITPTRLHQHFDALSSVDPARRSRGDKISNAAFDKIEAIFSAPVIKKFRKLRNKVIAHAADATSRAELENEFGFTLSEAEESLRLLCHAQHEVQINLLWNTSSSVMPVPQFDIMEHMDKPFLRPEQMEALAPFWQELARLREAWSHGG